MNKLLLIGLLTTTLLMTGCNFGNFGANNDTPSQDTTAPTDQAADIDQQAPAGDDNVVDEGDTVRVQYVGSLESDGSVFDTSREDVARENDLYNEMRTYEPLEFTVGAGQMIPGFDAGVVGMEVGDSKTITIPPEDGYGPVNPELVQVLPLSGFNEAGIDPVVGETYNFGIAQGTILEINDEEETVEIDFNHFLAGKTLVFEVELVEIVQQN